MAGLVQKGFALTQQLSGALQLAGKSLTDRIEDIDGIAFIHQASPGEGHPGPLEHDFFELIKLL